MRAAKGEGEASAETLVSSLRQAVSDVSGTLNQRLFIFGLALIETSLSGGWLVLLNNILKKTTRLASALYLVFTLLVFFSMRWVGEGNITTAFFLYLPPAIWLLPALPLLGLSLVFHRTSFFLTFGLLLVISYWFLGYRLTGAPEVVDKNHHITLMTYNRGQHMNQSLQPFKEATQPDLMLFQDAPNRAETFLRAAEYSEFEHGTSVGEFTLLSRFPIVGKTLLPESFSNSSTRFAKFEIDWQGQLVSIYSVHLKTPREVLSSYSKGAFLWGVLGVPGTPGAAKKKQYQVFWDQQIEDVEIILKAVRSDPNPCLMAGDFNAPCLGKIHKRVTSVMTDTHLAAGNGFGFSFPGVTNNPLSLGGPWLRIDYLFHDEHWKTIQCITEPDRPSQHRAVVARLKYLGNSRNSDGRK